MDLNTMKLELDDLSEKAKVAYTTERINDIVGNKFPTIRAKRPDLREHVMRAINDGTATRKSLTEIISIFSEDSRSYPSVPQCLVEEPESYLLALDAYNKEYDKSCLASDVLRQKREALIDKVRLTKDPDYLGLIAEALAL